MPGQQIPFARVGSGSFSKDASMGKATKFHVIQVGKIHYLLLKPTLYSFGRNMQPYSHVTHTRNLLRSASAMDSDCPAGGEVAGCAVCWEGRALCQVGLSICLLKVDWMETVSQNKDL